jgi:RNA polymerase sigma-70 factor (ECF subfamily)
VAFFKKQLVNFSDEELMVRLVKDDDHEALSELYKRYSNRLLGYFIKMFRGDIPKSQDFLQDLFLKIYERRDQFREDKKLYTWIFTIAANMCRTDFRKMPNDSLNEFHEQQLTNEADFFDRVKTNAVLREAINQLEHHHKVTFILKYLEGFSLQETAEITETNVGTVKSRLFYATQKLAERLKEYKLDYKEN